MALVLLTKNTFATEYFFVRKQDTAQGVIVFLTQFSL